MNSTLPSETARRLRIARLRAGLSQRELAERAGLGYQTARRLETGERDGNLSSFVAVCDALGVGLGDLVAGLPDVRDPGLREAWRRAEATA